MIYITSSLLFLIQATDTPRPSITTFPLLFLILWILKIIPLNQRYFLFSTLTTTPVLFPFPFSRLLCQKLLLTFRKSKSQRNLVHDLHPVSGAVVPPAFIANAPDMPSAIILLAHSALDNGIFLAFPSTSFRYKRRLVCNPCEKSKLKNSMAQLSEADYDKSSTYLY